MTTVNKTQKEKRCVGLLTLRRQRLHLRCTSEDHLLPMLFLFYIWYCQATAQPGTQSSLHLHLQIALSWHANRDTTPLLNTALKKYLHFEEDQNYEKVRQRPKAFCNSLIKAVKSWPLNRIWSCIQIAQKDQNVYKRMTLRPLVFRWTWKFGRWKLDSNRSLPKIPISVSKIRHRQDPAVITPFLRFKLTRTLVSRPP